MQVQFSDPLGNRDRASGFLRLIVFTLLTAAFACTTLHAQSVAYVTNDFSNTVSVIDTATNTVTATIPVGAGPVGVAFSPDGTRAYVTNALSHTVSMLDTAHNTVVATVSVLGTPAYPAVTPDGKTLYVPLPDQGNVDAISTTTNSVVAIIPVSPFVSAVAITPDGSHAYAAGQGSFSVIDTATNTVSAGPISVNSDEVDNNANSGLAVTPAGDAVYLAAGGFNGLVSVISTATNTVSATPTLPLPSASVSGLAITPDGSRVYAADANNNVVNIIDTATNTVEPAQIPVGSSPFAVAINPDGSSVYVVNQFGNNVSVIATATNTVVATVPVGDFPLGIAIANMSSPFSNLTITGLSVNKNGFTESGAFSLGASSTGIDLAHQPLTFTVDGFSLTIPPGSFKQVGGNMHFVFNGLSVSFNLMATGGTSTDFKFSVTVTGTDLTGSPNPATVSLKIGSNTGSTTAPF